MKVKGQHKNLKKKKKFHIKEKSPSLFVTTYRKMFAALQNIGQ